MTKSRQKKLAVIAGEESGQLLAYELVTHLNNSLCEPVSLVGIGGQQLQKLGLSSLFDADEIALTGVSSVIKNIPRLLRRINQTSEAIIKAKPNCLLLVDSPDFSLRVAKQVKRKLPDIKVVKYVAPTVWAWRPERAKKMSAYIDSILAILPFESEVMQKLGGPKTEYVGHRLMADTELLAAFEHNRRKIRTKGDRLNLLVLPGSRRNEINSLAEEFGKTAGLLHARGHDLKINLPTLPRLEETIHAQTANWVVKPIITTDRKSQIEAYCNADAALAASGTVTLELALAGVPAISCYKVDPLMKLAKFMITTWSAALPNIIADRPIIDEFYNEFVRYGLLARSIEELVMIDGKKRSIIMDAYRDIREEMATKCNPSEKAANIVADMLESKKPGT